MLGLDFDPLTGQYNIAGTSYGLQLGIINNKWAISLLKGKKTIDTMICKENDLLGSIPNPDLIVRWVLGAISFLNINPLHIKKTVNILLNQAKANKEKKKNFVSIKEANNAELKPVPKSELKKPMPIGWVVEEDPIEKINTKKTESKVLSNISCISCGYKIKCCPNCGVMFGKNLTPIS